MYVQDLSSLAVIYLYLNEMRAVDYQKEGLGFFPLRLTCQQTIKRCVGFCMLED